MQVSGGPGTLDVILQALEDERPIVIIADSGGVATDIYNFYRWGHVPDATDGLPHQVGARFRLPLMAFLIGWGASPEAGTPYSSDSG